MQNMLVPLQTLGARAVLAPRLQQGLRLLHLSEPEFAQVLRQAAAMNPFLRLELAQEEVVGLPSEAGEADGVDPLSMDDAWVRDGFASGHDGVNRLRGAEPVDVLDSVCVPLMLPEHLRQQLHCLRLAPRERALALALVDCLEDDGYLRMPLVEAVASAGLWPAPRADEASLALRRVQGLEPRGVGARDLRECLLLQLREATERAEGSGMSKGVLAGVQAPMLASVVPLARRLVRECLPELAVRDIAWLSQRLEAPQACVRAALARVRALDPRPGGRFGAAVILARLPDAIVRRRQGRWRVQLLAERQSLLRVDEDDARLVSQLSAVKGECARVEMEAQLQEARFWVRQARQRQGTVLAVAQAIAQRQARFLQFGPPALRPLALRDIAQDVGVHESTVSRATHGKCLDTPHGIFEMKYFFSRPLATARGGDCSPAAVRAVLRELIACERATAPLSDAALADALAAQGVVIARRTVTKYRQELRIAAAGRRHAGRGVAADAGGL